MFDIGSNTHYAIYDKNSHLLTEENPSTEIIIYGKKRKLFRHSPNWYPEFSLLVKAVHHISSTNKDFLEFSIKDYGFRKILGVYYQLIVDNESIYDNKEFYEATSGYDADDCFSLHVSINRDLLKHKICLSIIAIRYLKSTQIANALLPSRISKQQNQVISNIDYCRQQHKDISSVNPKAIHQCFSQKLPYDDKFREIAWQIYPHTLELLTWVEKECEKIEESILSLPNSIDLFSSSSQNEEIEFLYIPIECTYNKRFYARLYLARECLINNLIVSQLDLLQYQIAVNASNEPLLLALYASHWLEPVYSDTTNTIGNDKCANINQDILRYSPILASFNSIDERIGELFRENIVFESNIYKKYLSCRALLLKWVKNRLDESYRTVINYRPSLWKSEYMLYSYMKLFFPDAIYQYHADWLELQSLDIYIPSIKCAIEYQGQQHYKPIDFFGGDVGLAFNQVRDEQKRIKCHNNNVKVYDWIYSDKIVFSKVWNFINENFHETEMDLSYIVERLSSVNSLPISQLLFP